MLLPFAGCNNLFIFPFRVLFSGLSQLRKGVALFFRTASMLFINLGRMGGIGASAAANVGTSIGAMQRLQDLWTQVRPSPTNPGTH